MCHCNWIAGSLIYPYLIFNYDKAEEYDDDLVGDSDDYNVAYVKYLATLAHHLVGEYYEAKLFGRSVEGFLLKAILSLDGFLEDGLPEDTPVADEGLTQSLVGALKVAAEASDLLDSKTKDESLNASCQPGGSQPPSNQMPPQPPGP